MDPASSESARRPPGSAPRVSVIAPTYNREHYLPEAIDSVLRQTLRDLELLIVDDGSTDSTAALVRAIDDDRVRYFPTPHRGLSAALNVGLHHARGEFIARLDSDDVFLPDALATLVSALEKRSDLGVVWARGRLMDHDGHDQPRTRGTPARFPGDLLRSLLYQDCTTSPAMLTRRACFDRTGPYDEALAFSEDWDMALRLARHFRFGFVDEIVVRIREHDDTMTGKHSPRRAAFLETRTAPLDKLFREPNLPSEVVAMKPTAYANVHIFCGQMWLSTRNFSRASREFASAIRVSGRPLATAIAIFWRIGILQILERSATGRRIAESFDALGRRRTRRQYRLSRNCI